ncbi:hypothetical protein GLAREA_03687 [Glarea lozoyensis ATCC 20868]|uniref:EKC/KEOPS complex subunit CGI121 n=1 Tax=Glarea lozoyensis (strain ATCC 20868 / MF5171) TaxID=1116229 RepID=S3CYQ3_GLAL2|nr:uncharacterized protein GLAREA_03687 [Glarea lozoyensis ATCC 20868]EPE30720.1 hypothetical protein GLAREA_03687 [Glarea lozoyensis ATCC 20868]
MSLLETVQLEHLPPGYDISLALFRNVKNSAFLHEQLLAGNTEFEYALIDASVLVSRVHALAAVYRAVSDLLGGRLRSRNVHSEIVFSLSPNNNIAESFRRFGITPATTSLLVIKVSLPPSSTTDTSTASPLSSPDIQAHLAANIEGDSLPFTDASIASLTDVARIKKIYKLNSGGGAKKTKGAVNGAGIHGGNEDGNNQDEVHELEVAVLGAMALRGSNN